MDHEGYATLIEMLEDRAVRSGERAAFTFDDNEITYRELWAAVNHVGSNLLAAGIEPGERVVIALPNGPEFFSAFYGTQRAGGIAVPVYPNAGMERILNIARLCEASKVFVPPELPALMLNKYLMEAGQPDVIIWRVSDCHAQSAGGDFPRIQPEQVAFLQYTSGSTGEPKGVTITHANLLTNIRQMIAGMGITPQEIFVSWLPVHHDMGLILKTMVPFYLGAELHLLPTSLSDVRPWLQAIQDRRASFTAAPDFAYRLALRRVRPGEYNLSSLRVALNAAEPVRKNTVDDFHTFFGLENVMVAGYGLAEVTVGVSMWPSGTRNKVDDNGIVSVGPPFPEVEIAIISNGERLPAGEVGEIAIRSAANALGYYNAPEANAQLMWQDGFILSGDLGYLDTDGNLYIHSRKKNIIKRSGETISPWEIEQIVDRLPEVRYSAAVGVDRGMEEGEQVIVFAEIRDGERMAEQNLHEIAVRINAAVKTYMGFRLARAYLIRPKGIPLTDNGKLQHVRMRELYLEGALRRQGLILYPEF